MSEKRIQALSDDMLENVNGGSQILLVHNDPKGGSNKTGGLKGTSQAPGKKMCNACHQWFDQSELSLRGGKYYCQDCLRKLNAQA